MGDKHEPPQSVPASSFRAGAPSSTADDATVAADPFASTLTVSPAPAPGGPRLEPGRELGPVRLIREIGRGATGAVFHGHHRVLGRDVAVKFLINVTAGPGDAEGVKRFVDEARAAASVRHPNLTQIFHADLDGTTPYLVLEYVQGPTLRQLLDYAGGLSVPVTAAVLADVAAAVAELHARGLIHRDIKPSNVLIDKDGRVLVTDFGLALRRSHAAGHGAAEHVEFAGTPAYMAGEMFEGRVSPRSDVYAMGVTAFQLLTGVTPFAGTFHEVRDKHLHEPLPSALLCERGVKPAVVEVVERATSKQAMFRYKTAPDFARALREAAGCGMPELARARKHLCDLVIARGAGALAAGPATHAGATGEVRGPMPATADDDSGSSLYTETISRIATLKRERRRYPPGEGDGSSLTGSPAAPSDVSSGGPPAGRHDSTPAQGAGAAFAPARPPGAQPPAKIDDTALNPAAPTATRAGREPVPGPVLSVSVLAILYGVLALVWQVEVLLGAKNMSPQLPPATGAAVPLYFALVPAAIAHALIVGLFVLAGVGCLRLRSWGRRMMVGLGAADLVFQVAVLLLALAWIEPVTVSALLSLEKSAATVERAVLERSITTEWIVQWFALSLFPAFAVGVTTRRRVRDAFTAAAQRPVPEDEESEPFF